jgi:hypothetical protein
VFLTHRSVASTVQTDGQIASLKRFDRGSILLGSIVLYVVERMQNGGSVSTAFDRAFMLCVEKVSPQPDKVEPEQEKPQRWAPTGR